MGRIVGQASHPIRAEDEALVNALCVEEIVAYIVETMMVGIIRKGKASKTKRDSSHAVGL